MQVNDPGGGKLLRLPHRCVGGINSGVKGKYPAQSAGWQLHQHQPNRIELQMQNEDLRQIQSEPRESCGYDVELFNIYPVDCFTVADYDLIRKMNYLWVLKGICCNELSGAVFPNLRHTQVAPDTC
jgi:hypothetical protein